MYQEVINAKTKRVLETIDAGLHILMTLNQNQCRKC